MNRYIAPLFTCILLFLSACGRIEEKIDSAIGQRPNIIYILADDLGYGDLSVLGQKKFSTPNIDKLAANGMLFTQHYSGSTVCAPSRSALMTGQHTGHTYVRGNYEIRPEGQIPLPDSIPTLPKLLREAGYTTGAFGKWGLGFPGSEGDPVNHFDQFYGYNCQRLGHHYYPYHLWDNQTKVMLEENAGFAKGQYAPAMIHDETLAFIEDNKDDPFFCYIATVIPHAELAAPEENMAKYRGVFGEEIPYEGVDSGEDYRNGPYESQIEPHATFAAMVDLLDQQVGELVAKLDELGLLEKTLIVFTSDNGPHREGGADPDFFDSNGPFRGTKRDLYEGGIHVPMIAHWPGTVPADSKSEHISAFWDMLPTIADLAGFEVPEELDGISFASALVGDLENQKKHDYLYWEFHERGGRIAIRQGKWKAVRYDVLEKPDAPMELYNLEEDIGEQINIAGSHPEVVSRMETIFSEARTDSEVFTFKHRGYLQEN